MQGQKICRYGFDSRKMTELMESKGLTRKDLVKALKNTFPLVSEPTVRQWMNNNAASLEAGLAIAKVLGVSANVLTTTVSEKEWEEVLKQMPKDKKKRINDKNKMINEASV